MVLSKDRVPGVLLALDRFSHEGHIQWRSEEVLAVVLVALVVVGPLTFAVAVANRPIISIMRVSLGGNIQGDYTRASYLQVGQCGSFLGLTLPQELHRCRAARWCIVRGR